MKNLELLELVYKPTHGDIISEGSLFSHTPDSVYFIRQQILHKFNIVENSSVELCPLVFENAITLKVLTIEGKICVVSFKELCVIDLEDWDQVKTIPFQHEIAQISWNPTEELVVTVSSSGEVAVFNVDYTNGELLSRGVSSVHVQVPDTVYVGWGSKETQFRGSDRKLKHVSVEEEPVYDQKPSISWRGNGEMFAVNYWTDENRRKFVVFQVPCKAVYRSEPCPGLQCHLAWRPVGNMIATLAHNPGGGQSVIIFEKNGQKRFHFELNLDEVIKEIQWSPCANILTLHSESTTSGEQCLHLFTSSNYKWYAKQCLVFTSTNPLLHFTWLESTTHLTHYTLRVVTKKQMLQYTFHSVVNSFWGRCAVIDGKTVQITDFKQAIIPPPQYSVKLLHHRALNSVLLTENLVLVVDCGHILTVFQWDNLNTPLQVVDLVQVVDMVVAEFPMWCHHFVAQGDDVYFATESLDGKVLHHYHLQRKEMDVVGTTQQVLTHLLIIPQLGDGMRVTHIAGVLYMMTVNDTVVEYSVTTVGDRVYDCRLTSHSELYVNGDKIADSVSSYCVFGVYLLYTTRFNELHCLKLGQGVQYRRSVEQGATIIVAVPNTSTIVLQLPRGNLETILCRLVSIDIVDSFLTDGRWSDAVHSIRLEKLNANLLFDLNPQRFLQQIDQLVGSVRSSELNSLCLDFEEANVLQTLYQRAEVEQYPRKIATIFTELFKYFDSVDYAPYITTIMVVNLRFFTLGDALKYLQDLLARSHDDATLKSHLLEAVNTLKTYGCDQDQLYMQSLLLYDLDLTRVVASCCQMDPRLYQPQLATLEALEEVRRRYEVNVYAKRPQMAVAYLLRCPQVSSVEITAFIKAHEVSRAAYHTCTPNSSHFKAVSEAFAEDLSRRKCHHEAGVVLKRAGLLTEALAEFRVALRWREAVDVMTELGLSEVERRRNIEDLARKLAVVGRAEEAATLYEHYADSYEMAAKVLLQHYRFEEAVHVARKHGRKDIIISEIVPSLVSNKKFLHCKLLHLNDCYTKWRHRLGQVRQTRVTKLNYGTAADGDDHRNELLSDVDSVISKSSRSSRSRSSTASSRKRRKEERKKKDLREGGVYEDIALIRVLYTTIEEIYRTGGDVGVCCLLLMQEGAVSFQELKDFYQLYERVYREAQEGLVEIWPPHFRANCSQSPSVRELADLENFQHLDAEYRNPPDLPSDKFDLDLFTDSM